MVSKKTKRARLNPGELVYTFYFKLQHNSIISPEYSDGNDDAYDVMYYSYFIFFVLQIYETTRPIMDGFRKNNVNYWVFREIRSIIPHL